VELGKIVPLRRRARGALTSSTSSNNNGVTTRDANQRRDPRGAALLAEVYGDGAWRPPGAGGRAGRGGGQPGGQGEASVDWVVIGGLAAAVIVPRVLEHVLRGGGRDYRWRDGRGGGGFPWHWIVRLL
jgi:hypothetical protein